MKQYEKKALKKTIGYGIIGLWLILFAGFVFWGGSAANKDLILYIIFGSASLFTGIWCVFPMIPGAAAMPVNKWLREKGISKDAFDQDLSGGLSAKNGDFGIHYVVSYGERKASAMVLEDMVWIYGGMTDIKHKLYGVVTLGTSTNFTVTMIDRNNVEMIVVMETQEKQKEALTYLEQRAPYAAFGYSDSLNRTRKEHFDFFVKAADEKKEGIRR